MRFENGPEESKACPICLGSGFVKLNVEVGHPDFGRAKTCTCRDEAFKMRRAQYLSEICRIPRSQRTTDIAMFPDYQDHLDGWVRRSGEQQSFVGVFGAYGVGKTTMLCSAVNHAVGKGLVGVYVTMADLLEHIRRAYHPDSKVDQDKFWDTLVTADVLSLDEVDRWRPTPWAREKFFALIDQRYRAGKGVTFIATNKQIAQGVGILEETPGYFESRLLEAGNAVIELIGPDRRQKRQQAML